MDQPGPSIDPNPNLDNDNNSYNSDNEMDDFDMNDIALDRDDALFTFIGHEPDHEQESAAVYQLDYYKDLVISGGHDDHLRVWSVNNEGVNRGDSFNKQLFSVKFEDTVHQVGFNKCENLRNTFYAIDMAGNVKVFLVKDREELIKNTPDLDLPPASPSSLKYDFELIFETSIGLDVSWACWHPKASCIFIGTENTGEIYMFMISSKIDKNYSLPPRIYISSGANGGCRTTCYCWINDKNLLVGYESGQVSNFSLKETTPTSTIDNLDSSQKFHYETSCMSLSNDGNLVAVGRNDGRVSILLVSNLEKIRVLHTIIVDETKFVEWDEEEGENGPGGESMEDQGGELPYRQMPQSIEAVEFQPESSRCLLACGCMNGSIVIYEMNRNQKFFKRSVLGGTGDEKMSQKII